MSSVCDQLTPNMEREFLEPAQRIMSDEIHRILYCYMSKVGCTAFKTLIARANAKRLNAMHILTSGKIHSVNTTKKLDFGRLYTSGMTHEQIQHRLNNYFTFMITRHPMDRLLSVYRDKIVDHFSPNGSYMMRVRLPILQHARPQLFSAVPNTSQSEREHYLRKLEKQHVPSFQEFIQWVVEKRVFNEHWLSAVESCHPCAHNWSAILRLESMAADKDLLLEQLGRDAPEDVRRVHATANHGSFFTSLQLREWENIPADHEDYFLRLYRQDMELFGYHWDRDSKTTDCYIPTAQGVCC